MFLRVTLTCPASPMCHMRGVREGGGGSGVIRSIIPQDGHDTLIILGESKPFPSGRRAAGTHRRPPVPVAPIAGAPFAGPRLGTKWGGQRAVGGRLFESGWGRLLESGWGAVVGERLGGGCWRAVEGRLLESGWGAVVGERLGGGCWRAVVGERLGGGCWRAVEGRLLESG